MAFLLYLSLFIRRPMTSFESQDAGAAVVLPGARSDPSVALASVRPMQLVRSDPNVELREDPGGGQSVVLAFPYDARIVARERT